MLISFSQLVKLALFMLIGLVLFHELIESWRFFDRKNKSPGVLIGLDFDAVFLVGLFVHI